MNNVSQLLTNANDKNPDYWNRLERDKVKKYY